MITRHSYVLLVSLVLLGTLAACRGTASTPPSTPVTSSPTPTATSPPVSPTLMPVRTGDVFPTATSTPTQPPPASPTFTLTPTPTEYIAPTPTPTSTPSPTPTPAAGVEEEVVVPPTISLLEEGQVTVPDDWLWFTSEPFGFRIAYPPDWLAIDLAQEEWEALLAEVSDPDVRALLTDSVRRMVAGRMGAFIVAVTPEEGAGGQPFVSNLNIVRTSVPADADRETLLQAIVTTLEGIEGLEVRAVNQDVIAGYPATTALYSYPTVGADGSVLPVVGWQVYLRPRPDVLYVLTFTTLANVLYDRGITFVRMAGSFQLVTEEP